MKYANPNFKEVLKSKSPNLYHDLKDWMEKFCFEYNTQWYSMDAFQYYKDHVCDPYCNIKSIRMFSLSRSVKEAMELGQRLAKKLDFIVSKCGDDDMAKNYFAYLTHLIYKYHANEMVLEMSEYQWHDTIAYISGVRDQDLFHSKFRIEHPGRDDFYDNVKPSLEIGKSSNTDEVKIFDLLTGIMLNKYTNDDIAKLFEEWHVEPVLSNTIYKAYFRFMQKYALGVAYDIENDIAFRYHVCSITDSRIYRNMLKAAEFCIQVFLLSLKPRYMARLWAIISYGVQDAVMSSLPAYEDVKYIQYDEKRNIIFSDVSFTAPRETVKDKEIEAMVEKLNLEALENIDTIQVEEAKLLLSSIENPSEFPGLINFIHNNTDDDGYVTYTYRLILGIMARDFDRPKKDDTLTRLMISK